MNSMQLINLELARNSERSVLIFACTNFRDKGIRTKLISR